ERVKEDLRKMNTATREVRRAAELLSRTATGDAEKIRNGIEPTGIARWLGIILKDFETAMQDKDTVTVGDLSEYEISPRLTMISEAVGQL
ncbi:MAG: hypothetical protein II461_01290, partial [Treponema sp.]|nr:hypothetical protein [Treponema sp.]